MARHQLVLRINKGLATKVSVDARQLSLAHVHVTRLTKSKAAAGPAPPPTAPSQSGGAC